jgi:hypothetical protein
MAVEKASIRESSLVIMLAFRVILSATAAADPSA